MEKFLEAGRANPCRKSRQWHLGQTCQHVLPIIGSPQGFPRLFSLSPVVPEGKKICVLRAPPDALFCLARSLESIRQCGVALCIVLGFSILSASIASSVVRDRVIGAKRLQHLSGLGYRTYWLTNFLYDMVGLERRHPGGLRAANLCV